jgi:hypothetical protein
MYCNDYRQVACWQPQTQNPAQLRRIGSLMRGVRHDQDSAQVIGRNQIWGGHAGVQPMPHSNPPKIIAHTAQAIRQLVRLPTFGVPHRSAMLLQTRLYLPLRVPKNRSKRCGLQRSRHSVALFQLSPRFSLHTDCMMPGEAEARERGKNQGRGGFRHLFRALKPRAAFSFLGPIGSPERNPSQPGLKTQLNEGTRLGASFTQALPSA